MTVARISLAEAHLAVLHARAAVLRAGDSPAVAAAVRGHRPLGSGNVAARYGVAVGASNRSWATVFNESTVRRRRSSDDPRTSPTAPTPPGESKVMDFTDQLDGATRLFPIIGDPIKYVESPKSLTRALQARQHNGICVPIQVGEDDLAPVMAALTAAGNVDGILVTMPHKFAAFDYCATTSQTTSLLKVVSVIRRNPDRSWHGDMLDGKAFVKAQIDKGATIAGARALLLGAGGAGSAIAVELLHAEVSHLGVCDTDPSRTSALIELLAHVGHGQATKAPPDPAGYDLVFNATPLGMNHDDPLPLDTARLDPTTFVGDVIAGHGLTPFLEAAHDAGCATAGGGHMVAAVQDLMADFMLNRKTA